MRIYHILSSSTIVSWTWGKLKYVDSLEILFPIQLDRPAGVSPFSEPIFPNLTDIPTQLDRMAGVSPHLPKPTNIS